MSYVLIALKTQKWARSLKGGHGMQKFWRAYARIVVVNPLDARYATVLFGQ